MLLARLTMGAVPLIDLTLEASVALLASGLALLIGRLPHARMKLLASSLLATGLGTVAFGAFTQFGFRHDFGDHPNRTLGVCFVLWGANTVLLLLRRPAWLAPSYAVASSALVAMGWALREPLGAAVWPWLGLAALALGGAFVMRTASGVLWGAVGGLVAALIPGAGPSMPTPRWADGSADTQAPDVLLIVADTLRADVAQTMSSYPRLTGAAQDLGPAVAAAPWTLPAVASIMTGQPPDVHGAGRQPDGSNTAIRASLPMLAERLKSAGYDTAAVLAVNPFVSGTFGMHRGFQVFDYAGRETLGFSTFPRDQGIGRPALSYLLHRTVYRLKSRLASRLIAPLPPDGSAFTVLDRARFILAQRRERPLFLWVHLMDVHVPYTHAYQLDMPDEIYARVIGHTPKRWPFQPHWFDDEATHTQYQRAYANQARRMDDALSKFLSDLGPAPARGRVIVLTADHGNEFWEHGAFGHGHALWQELVAVPLSIEGIAVQRRDVSNPASHLDIAPTILRAAGLDASDLPGQPLTEPPGARRLVSQNVDDDRFHTRAVREGALKLIQGPNETLLFDLRSDAAEQSNVCAQRPDECDSLKHQKSNRDALQTVSVGDAVDVPEAQQEVLRSLGYAQ